MQNTSAQLQMFSEKTLNDHFAEVGKMVSLGSGSQREIQDFSLAGKQAGLDGKRSVLILEAIRLLRECQPSVFIWENVKGTFSSNDGADFWAILNAFTNIGEYRLEWQLLNTSWVLPQNRERIYLVGHLRGRSIGQIFPFTENDRLSDKQEQTEKGRTQAKLSTTLKASGAMKTDDTFIEIPKKAGCLTGGGNSGGLHSDMTVIPVNKVVQVDKENKESGGNQPYQQNRVYDTNGIAPALLSEMSSGTHKVKAQPVLTPNRLEKRQNGRRFKEDGEPAFTLNCQDQHGILVEKRIRRLTEIENERLQGFPDDWTKYGNYDGEIKEISKTQRYKLCGNAVTTKIVKAIGERIQLVKR